MTDADCARGLPAAFAYLKRWYDHEALTEFRGPSPDETSADIGKRLAARLEDCGQFGLARRVVRAIRKSLPEGTKEAAALRERTDLLLREARLTARDADLPRAYRVTRAWDLVDRAAQAEGGLSATRDRTVLLAAASVCKRRWEHDATIEELELCLQFYEAVMTRLAEPGTDKKVGAFVRVDRRHVGVIGSWIREQVPPVEGESDQAALRAFEHFQQAAVNIGFVSDLLANQLKKLPSVSAALGVPARIEALHEVARDSREAIAAVFKEGDSPPAVTSDRGARIEWWRAVTAAEAYLGLGRPKAAERYFATARQVHEKWHTPVWWAEIAARQAATLVAILHPSTSAADMRDRSVADASAVAALLGSSSASLQTSPGARMGLALSGGGFRAAFFHLGVLAALAEWDLLRSVEVVSCVSGGAIVGTMLQLRLRGLLESTPEPIPRSAYVDLVEHVVRDFAAAARRNVRARVFVNPVDLLRMIFGGAYSRSHRLAKLYDRYFFAPTLGLARKTRTRTSDLLILPTGSASGRASPSIRSENFSRCAKVPMLVLSATTLNTGHAWHFTGTWMGEPPGSVDPESNASERLRRMYYADAPPRYRDGLSLAECVAASSAVPGAFPPIPLPKLYPQRTVYLTDGGLRDNQGLEALLDQECSHIIASDGSGQIDSELNPVSSVLTTLSRSSQVSQARVRESQLEKLRALEASGVIRKYAVVHLRGGIPVHTVDWIGCEEASDEIREARPESPASLPPALQEAVANVRTDLDAFNDLEADSLMYAGYTSMHATLERRAIGSRTPPARREWIFSHVASRIADPIRCDRLLAVLRRGKHRFFRWALDRVFVIPLLVATVLGAILFRASIGHACVACNSRVAGLVGWFVGSVDVSTGAHCDSPACGAPEGGNLILRLFTCLPLAVIFLVWLVRRVRQLCGLAPPRAGYLEYLLLVMSFATGFWLLVQLYLATVDRFLLWKHGRARS